MNIDRIGSGYGKDQPRKTSVKTGGEKLPEDTFVKSGKTDSITPKMEKLSKFKTKDVGDALFSKSKKAVEKLEDQVIKEHSLWHYEKRGHTICDTVRDEKRDVIYTGVGHLEKWYLTAMNPDGTVKWSFKDERGQSAPVLDNKGNIYFRTDKNLYSFDPDGNVNWKFPNQSSWNDSPPAVGPDGTVYIVTSQDHISYDEENQALVAVKDGKELWRYKAHGDYTGDPQPIIGKDGTIFFGASKDVKKGIIFKSKEEKPFLIALNPDGTEKFRADVKSWPSYVNTQLTEGPDGTVYACHGDKNLTAFDPATGKEKWTFHLEDKVQVNHSGSHARLNQVPEFDEEGNIYIASDITSSYPEGYLIKLDKSGKEQWTQRIGGGFSTKPHIGKDGTIWVGTGRGSLMSYSKQGKRKGSYKVGEMYSNNFSFGDDGEIYLNTQKRILAFQPDMDKIPSDAEKEISQVEPEQESEESGIKIEKNFVEIGGIKLPRGRNFKKI